MTPVIYLPLSTINLKEYVSKIINISALLVHIEERISKNNSTYLDLTIKDKKETLSIKIFNVTSNIISEFGINKVYGFTGTVRLWQDKPQIDLVSFTQLDEDIDKYKANPFNPQPYLDIIENTFNSLNSKTVYYKITRTIYNKYLEQIKRCPAAITNHHTQPGELLMHIADMLKAGKNISEVYTDINWDLLACGIILHDIGKIYEYKVDDLNVVSYTMYGSLLGHICIMLQEIEKTIIALNINNNTEVKLLENMIASHHGKLEYGSPVLPCTLEARILNHLDMMDAEHYRAIHVLEKAKEGELVSQKVGNEYENYIKIPDTDIQIVQL